MSNKKYAACRFSARVLLLGALALFSAPMVSWAVQCNDGVDNDGDGKIDALVEAPTAGTWNEIK